VRAFLVKFYESLSNDSCPDSRSQTNGQTWLPYNASFFLSFLLCKELILPWNKLFLEKIVIAQLPKTVPGLYGTRRLIAVFTSAHRWILSWAMRIQPTTHTYSYDPF
jgi:hypothetical protein